MIKYRLNKEIIERAMAEKKIGLFDLARLLGWSPQLTHYAINHGSKSFASKIAQVLGIKESDLIMVVKGGPGKDSALCGAASVNRQP